MVEKHPRSRRKTTKQKKTHSGYIFTPCTCRLILRPPSLASVRCRGAARPVLLILRQPHGIRLFKVSVQRVLVVVKTPCPACEVSSYARNVTARLEHENERFEPSFFCGPAAVRVAVDCRRPVVLLSFFPLLLLQRGGGRHPFLRLWRIGAGVVLVAATRSAFVWMSWSPQGFVLIYGVVMLCAFSRLTLWLCSCTATP